MNNVMLILKDTIEPKYQNRDEVLFSREFASLNLKIIFLTSLRTQDYKKINKKYFLNQDKKFNTNNIHIHRFLSIKPLSLNTTIYFVNPLILLRNKFRYVFAHVTGSYSSYLGIFLKLINKNCKLILKPDFGSQMMLKASKNPFYRFLIKTPIKYADIIITLSFTEEELIKTLCPVKKILTIPPHINTTFYANIKSFEKISTIGILARLSPQKGYLRILNTLKEIINLYQLQIQIAGPISDEQYAQKVLHSYNDKLKDKFYYSGVVKATEFFTNCQLILVPSYYETGSITTLEAMSAGLIVIASNIIPHNEYIKNYENGFLFSHPSQIKSYIEYLFNNSQVIKTMSHNAKESVKKYDLRFLKSKMSKILKNIE